MECYATPWRLGGRVGFYIFLQGPPIPRTSPLSSFEGIFLSFCPLARGCARLRARGLARGTAIFVYYQQRRLVTISVLWRVCK